ncbi:MAG: hypothetical protein FD175_2377 [Beijerinckiaceae bacterium]|nr:MAG: hypothetical protein FD175_2377 [Beijerinckiaceae bacterium]
MRGRNRRGPNPLTRSFESNGPDVKVRGTAQHVAEKYTQLARDAHVSGDPVMAESYLQHAEHYYRLIAAAHQAQLAQQNGTADENDDDDDFDTASDRFNVRTVQQNQQPGQPSFSGERGQGEGGEGAEPGDGDEQPHERPTHERQDRHPGRGDRPHNNDRNRDRNRNQDRGFRQGNDRQGNDRNAGGDRGQDRNQDRNNPERGGFAERGGFNPNRPRRPQPDLEGAEQPVLPAFLTAPVRPISVEMPEAVATQVPAIAEAGDEAGGAPFRARRRRRVRIGEGGEGPAFETETSGSDQS